MVQLLTVNAQGLSEAIGQALGTAVGGVVLILALCWGIGMLVLMPTVAVITWVVKRVWYSGSNGPSMSQQRKWQKQQREWQKFQERQAWEDHMKKATASSGQKDIAHNPDWKWDDNAKIWRHKSQWDKMEQ